MANDSGGIPPLSEGRAILFKLVPFTGAIGFAILPAHAQMAAPPIQSALPHMNSVAASNAAGVLHYCVSKKLVSRTSADVVFDRLRKKPGVTNTDDFAAGASGEIRGNKRFLIPDAPGFVQSQACDLVLRRAKSLAVHSTDR